MADSLKNLEEALERAQKDLKSIKSQADADNGYAKGLRVQVDDLKKEIADLESKKGKIEAQIKQDKADVLKRIEKKEQDADAEWTRIRATSQKFVEEQSAFAKEKKDFANDKAQYESDKVIVASLKKELEDKLSKHKELVDSLK